MIKSAQPASYRKHQSRTAAPHLKRQQREAAHLVLLIQAGWVGITLILVAYIPAWTSYLNRAAKHESVSAVPSEKPKVSPSAATVGFDRQQLFTGGSESLVARTVGHAEGTRTPDGRKTRAYYGHVDPGNGVWNLGSFSFQHCQEARYRCSTPEQADEYQLRRLQAQDAQLQQRTKVLGLELTIEEELNGIDLANQAPLAALSDASYLDHLLQAKQKGLPGQDAILEARVWSYWNPQIDRWDAPGLGNSEATIRHDQKRRLLAIARAMDVTQQQQQPISERLSNLLKLQPETANPYSLSRQPTHYLWWDAGFWDGIKQQRQIPAGDDPAYDEGFKQGANF